MNLQDYIKSGAVKFLVDFRKKTLVDEITGSNPSVETGFSWKNTRLGSGVNHDVAGGSRIAYPALGAAYPNKTIIVVFQKTQSKSGLQEFFNSSGSDDSFNFLFDNGVWGVYSYGSPGAGFSSSGYTSDAQPHCYAARYQSGKNHNPAVSSGAPYWTKANKKRAVNFGNSSDKRMTIDHHADFNIGARPNLSGYTNVGGCLAAKFWDFALTPMQIRTETRDLMATLNV